MKTTHAFTLKLLGLATTAVAVLGLGLAGCQSHYTTQEAYDTCHELVGETGETDDPEVFSDCVACHEDCGTDCNQLGTSPESFSCPDEEGAGGGTAEDGESEETAEE